MLDISKITEKIPKIGKYLRQEASANSQKLERGRTILQEAQKLGMPLTRLATWKNAKDNIYQSNFVDAYNSFYEEVNHKVQHCLYCFLGYLVFRTKDFRAKLQELPWHCIFP